MSVARIPLGPRLRVYTGNQSGRLDSCMVFLPPPAAPLCDDVVRALHTDEKSECNSQMANRTP